jgi:hypothetical protein
MGVGLIDKKQVTLMAQESRSLGVMFYIAGVLYGILFLPAADHRHSP